MLDCRGNIVPNYLVTGHELIHVLHHLTKKHAGANEEFQTVGLGAFAEDRFTENKLRKAFGLEPRLEYGGQKFKIGDNSNQSEAPPDKSVVKAQLFRDKTVRMQCIEVCTKMEEYLDHHLESGMDTKVDRPRKIMTICGKTKKVFRDAKGVEDVKAGWRAFSETHLIPSAPFAEAVKIVENSNMLLLQRNCTKTISLNGSKMNNWMRHDLTQIKWVD